MISKVLFEEITGWHDDFEELSFHGNKRKKYGYKAKNYNIHELAHKCKEWAIKQINCYGISSGVVGKNYFCVVEIRPSYLGFKDSDQYFKSDTESEAIFKACQWVLENKDK